eukprot:COSAG06_NODE_77352_length_115_cov_4781.062500_1_plen_28_part_10
MAACLLIDGLMRSEQGPLVHTGTCARER